MTMTDVPRPRSVTMLIELEPPTADEAPGVYSWSFRNVESVTTEKLNHFADPVRDPLQEYYDAPRPDLAGTTTTFGIHAVPGEGPGPFYSVELTRGLLVERVARALWKHVDEEWGHEDCESDWRDYADEAEAAIAAIMAGPQL